MTPMRYKDFEQLLARRGADLGAWPEHERGAAQALVHANAEARALLADFQRLDLLLSEAAIPEPDAVLSARIVASARGLRQFAAQSRARNAWLDDAANYLSERLLRWMGAGFATALALGIAIGMQSVENQVQQNTSSLREWSSVAPSDPGSLL